MSIHRGVCPVYTERHQSYDEREGKVWDGKPAKHIMLRAEHGRGGGVTGTIEHPFEGNFARCSGCGHEERDYHFCDFPVSSYVGGWPHWSTHDVRAKHLVTEMHGLMNDVKRGQFWVCAAHTVARHAEKLKEKGRKEQERYDAQTVARRYGWVGAGYEALLVSVSSWLAQNRDLIEADEWLKTIVNSMDKDANLQGALLKAWGHRFILPRGGSHDYD